MMRAAIRLSKPASKAVSVTVSAVSPFSSAAAPKPPQQAPNNAAPAAPNATANAAPPRVI